MRLIDACDTAEVISNKFNIPMADLVDVFAEIKTPESVNKIKEEMCDHYCRFVYSCKTEEELIEKHCSICPMNKLEVKNEQTE